MNIKPLRHLCDTLAYQPVCHFLVVRYFEVFCNLLSFNVLSYPLPWSPDWKRTCYFVRELSQELHLNIKCLPKILNHNNNRCYWLLLNKGMATWNLLADQTFLIDESTDSPGFNLIIIANLPVSTATLVDLAILSVALFSVSVPCRTLFFCAAYNQCYETITINPGKMRQQLIICCLKDWYKKQLFHKRALDMR